MRVAAGNENERRHLLPLVDELLARGIKPDQLWADRGYASRPLEQELRARQIEPRISRPRRRVATRRDRKPDTYLAFVQLAMILILARSF